MAAPVSVRWTEEVAPTGATRLFVRHMVQPVAPPILLLHGLGADGSVWQPFARRLAPAWAAIAPDLPGHGRSGPTSSGSYQPAEYAADLARWRNTAFPVGMPVVGHSLGALVALQLAAEYAALVTRLVLVDPPLDAGEDRVDMQTTFGLRNSLPGELEAHLRRIYPGLSEMAVAALAGQFRIASDAAFEAMLAAPAGHPEGRQAAGDVQAPTLVVQADPAHGGILGDDAARDLMSALPAGQLVQIPGASHAVHASRPRELAEALLAFLA